MAEGVGGTSADLAKSVFQKCVRLGERDKYDAHARMAMAAAAELLTLVRRLSPDADDKERSDAQALITNMLNRMCICAVEDVAANPPLVLAVLSLVAPLTVSSSKRQPHQMDRSENGRALFLRLMGAVYRLAGSDKFRPSVLSHKHAIANRNVHPHVEIPVEEMRMSDEYIDELLVARDPRLFATVMSGLVENTISVWHRLQTAWPTFAPVLDFFAPRFQTYVQASRKKRKNVKSDAHCGLAAALTWVCYQDELKTEYGADTWYRPLDPTTAFDLPTDYQRFAEALWDGRYRIEVPNDSVARDKHVRKGEKQDAGVQNSILYFRKNSRVVHCRLLQAVYEEFQPEYEKSKASGLEHIIV